MLVAFVVVELVTVIVLPKVMPEAPFAKTMPLVEAVVIEPLSVMAPVVVTLNRFNAVPVPAAPSVTLPEPEAIVKDCGVPVI